MFGKLVLSLLEPLAQAAPLILPLLARGPGRPPIEGPEAALESRTRRDILALVRRRPGITLYDVRHRLDLGSSSLDLHVKTLVKTGLLARRRSGRFIRLYLAGEAPESDDPQLIPESTREVARVLLRRARSSSEIAEATGCTVQVARRHIRVLLDAGLVAEDIQGRTVLYVPTDRLHEAASRWRKP